MRICIVSPYFPSYHIPNYIEGIFLLREAIQLTKRGHRFFVVTCRHRGLPKFEIVKGIPVYRVSSVLVPKIEYPIPNILELTNTIIRVCKQYNVDLLDFWDQSYLTSLPIIFLKKMIKVPITITVGGLPGINWFYGQKIVDYGGLLYSVFLGRLILTNSDEIRSEFSSMSMDLRRMGIPRNKVHTLMRGVDTEIFRPNQKEGNKKTALGIKEDNVVILFSGRLEKVKGIEYLLKAAKQLLEEYNNLTFVFMGEGTLRRKYEKVSHSLREKVIFLGFRHDVRKVMNAADIFVLPSRSESAAISVLEANACGLPVVASRVGAIPEIIKDRLNGFCVTPKNVNELTGALRKLIANPSLAKEMGRRGRIYVKQHFSQEVVSSNVEEYYRRLIDVHSMHTRNIESFERKATAKAGKVTGQYG